MSFGSAQSVPEVTHNSCCSHSMPFGAELQADGSVRFRAWAPEAEQLQIALEDVAEPLVMRATGNGWHELRTTAATAGSRYRYVLPNGLHVPDPVSRYQPEDVNGPSQVMDPHAFVWQHPGWKGRPWEETILYELHVGTFTPEGTFLGAISKLDYLVYLGITAIEIMSLGEFPGAHNWGYDGVLLYAPNSNYGTPDELKALVDAAHGHGLMVILDVVYNHFGPEGNYLAQFYPDICTDRYQTPWGQALNFDAANSDRTREFILENALYWIEEFRMDGLRLDAVHAIIDSSALHILDELAARVRGVAGHRHVHLVLESDEVMWQRLQRDTHFNPLLSTAQWNHDSKQLLVLGLTPEDSAERDCKETERLGRSLTEGFTSVPPMPAVLAAGAEAVEWIAPKMPAHIPPGGFVSFLQTHDLVGNRLRGERVSDLTRPEVIYALAAVYLLAPQIPMLFMGEEWGASSPFPYFCSFTGELGEAVRRGRLEQFATAAQRDDPAFLATVPDPLSPETFLSAKLHWDELTREPHAEMLLVYRSLLAVRRRSIVPLLRSVPDYAGTASVRGPRTLEVRWRLATGELRLDANLSDRPGDALSPLLGTVIWERGGMTAETTPGPWSVRWSFAEVHTPIEAVEDLRCV